MTSTHLEFCIAWVVIVTIAATFLFLAPPYEQLRHAYAIADGNLSTCRTVHIVSDYPFDAQYAIAHLSSRHGHHRHKGHLAGAYVHLKDGTELLMEPVFSGLFTPNATHRLNMSAFHRDAHVLVACP